MHFANVIPIDWIPFHWSLFVSIGQPSKKKVEALSLTFTTHVVPSQNTSLCTLTFGMTNTLLVRCLPVLFDVKPPHFYLIFIILVFCQVSGVFREGSVGFWVVPARFRVVLAGSRWVLLFTYTPHQEVLNCFNEWQKERTMIKPIWIKKAYLKDVYKTWSGVHGPPLFFFPWFLPFLNVFIFLIIRDI